MDFQARNIALTIDVLAPCEYEVSHKFYDFKS